MFHVIEHLESPLQVLEQCRKHLKKDGKIIIETPNSDDALISLYHSQEFADFTYWSPHIFLYNEMNLSRLIQKAGYKVDWFKQIQRYPLSNHLFWLSEGKSGGQSVYNILNDEVLNEQYSKILSENKLCDTLMVCLEDSN